MVKIEGPVLKPICCRSSSRGSFFDFLATGASSLADFSLSCLPLLDASLSELASSSSSKPFLNLIIPV